MYTNTVLLCTEYKCNNSECKGLHLCEYYIGKGCRNGSNCTGSHDLKDKHNSKVLEESDCHDVSIHQLKRAYSEAMVSSRVSNKLPAICTYYNNIKLGCWKKNCPFLHICKHFVTDTCKFGIICGLSHDLREHEPYMCLKKNGIDVDTADKANGILEYLKNSILSNYYLPLIFSTNKMITEMKEDIPVLAYKMEEAENNADVEEPIKSSSSVNIGDDDKCRSLIFPDFISFEKDDEKNNKDLDDRGIINNDEEKENSMVFNRSKLTASPQYEENHSTKSNIPHVDEEHKTCLAGDKSYDNDSKTAEESINDDDLEEGEIRDDVEHGDLDSNSQLLNQGTVDGNNEGKGGGNQGIIDGTLSLFNGKFDIDMRANTQQKESFTEVEANNNMTNFQASQPHGIPPDANNLQEDTRNVIFENSVGHLPVTGQQSQQLTEHLIQQLHSLFDPSQMNTNPSSISQLNSSNIISQNGQSVVSAVPSCPLGILGGDAGNLPIHMLTEALNTLNQSSDLDGSSIMEGKIQEVLHLIQCYNVLEKSLLNDSNSLKMLGDSTGINASYNPSRQNTNQILDDIPSTTNVGRFMPYSTSRNINTETTRGKKIKYSRPRHLKEVQLK